MSIIIFDLSRRRRAWSSLATAILFSLAPGIALAASLTAIDLHGKDANQIAAIREAIKDSGTIKAEIKTGLNGVNPDGWVFEPKVGANLKSLIPPETLRDLINQQRDLVQRYVSDRDVKELLKKTELQPLKPMSGSCSTATQQALSQGVTGGSDPDVDQTAQGKIFADVERACMNPLVSAANAIDDAAPAWAKSEQVHNVVGVLYSESNGKWSAFCTALLYTSDHLVTARHCLFDPDDGSPNGRGQDLADGHVYFRLPRSDLQPIRVKRANHASTLSQHAFSYDEDVVLLDLSLSVPFTPPGIAFRDPTKGEDLLVAGIAGHAAADDAAPASLLRYTANAECRTLVVRGGCVRHDCQTGGGFSGAPMFAAPNDEEARTHTIRVAGFHLGPSIMGPCRDAATSTPGYETAANEGLGASVAQSFIRSWLVPTVSQR